MNAVLNSQGRRHEILRRRLTRWIGPATAFVVVAMVWTAGPAAAAKISGKRAKEFAKSITVLGPRLFLRRPKPTLERLSELDRVEHGDFHGARGAIQAPYVRLSVTNP